MTDFIVQEGPKKLTIKNSANRTVTIALAADPDVRITEHFGTTVRQKVAIEIKGGTDVSNAHNRAGEAEKSHQKAKVQGFREFWTVIAKKGLNVQTLQAESPTTQLRGSAPMARRRPLSRVRWDVATAMTP